MRIATWNLWWKFGPWEARQPAILETLQAIDADVILLQEVFGPTADHDLDQAASLADALGHHWIATTSQTARTPFGSDTTRTPFGSDTTRTPFGSDTARTPFGNAVLSRWPILDRAQRRLPGFDGKPSHRTALWALLDHPDGPQPVATTHLEWRYDASKLRQQQLDDLVTWLAEQHRRIGEQPSGEGAGGDAGGNADPTRHRPLVLGGDLNAVPESDEVRRLVGLSVPYGQPGETTPEHAAGRPVHGDRISVFTDAWAACGDGPGHTWTRDNEHAADAQWPRRRLDYVFSSWPRPKPTGNPLSCRLEGLKPVGGVIPSDHACVVAEFDDRPAFDDAPPPTTRTTDP